MKSFEKGNFVSYWITCCVYSIFADIWQFMQFYILNFRLLLFDGLFYFICVLKRWTLVLVMQKCTHVLVCKVVPVYIVGFIFHHSWLRFIPYFSSSIRILLVRTSSTITVFHVLLISHIRNLGRVSNLGVLLWLIVLQDIPTLPLIISPLLFYFSNVIIILIYFRGFTILNFMHHMITFAVPPPSQSSTLLS